MKDQLLFTHIESAYSLIWDAQRIWGQDLSTFMIVGLINKVVISCNLAFGILGLSNQVANQVIFLPMMSFYNIRRQQCVHNMHNLIFFKFNYPTD